MRLHNSKNYALSCRRIRFAINTFTIEIWVASFRNTILRDTPCYFVSTTGNGQTELTQGLIVGHPGPEHTWWCLCEKQTTDRRFDALLLVMISLTTTTSLSCREMENDPFLRPI